MERDHGQADEERLRKPDRAGPIANTPDAREARVKDDKLATKTEVLLDSAGLSIDDIAAIMNKKYDAVRISIQRNRTR